MISYSDMSFTYFGNTNRGFSSIDILFDDYCFRYMSKIPQGLLQLCSDVPYFGKFCGSINHFQSAVVFIWVFALSLGHKNSL